MSIFNAQVSEAGFIDPKTILKYVSEEQIFELVFGFKPIEFQYVCSPFREDSKPGCWFEHYNGKLRFKDFASEIFTNGFQLISMDCFDAVKYYFKLPNLYKALEFIHKKLISNKDVKIREIKTRIQKAEDKKIPFLIFPETRNFQIQDKEYWQDRYMISKDNLISDLVFPISSFYCEGAKYGNYRAYTRDIAYVYTDFLDDKKKIYRPTEEGKRRFVTNCVNNDIGGYTSIDFTKDTLIITKSYKDWRVLKNQGLNTIWFQNEGMFPDLTLLFEVVSHFKRVVIFFDNDEAGIVSSNRLVDIINSYLPGKSYSVHLPVRLLEQQIFDPADLIYKRGRDQLIDFLIYKNIF